MEVYLLRNTAAFAKLPDSSKLKVNKEHMHIYIEIHIIHLLSNLTFLVVESEMFYIARDKKEKLVCRTLEQKQEAFLKAHHRTDSNQHSGVNMTMANLVSKYYWIKMTKNVHDWVSNEWYILHTAFRECLCL